MSEDALMNLRDEYKVSGRIVTAGIWQVPPGPVAPDDSTLENQLGVLGEVYLPWFSRDEEVIQGIRYQSAVAEIELRKPMSVLEVKEVFRKVTGADQVVVRGQEDLSFAPEPIKDLSEETTKAGKLPSWIWPVALVGIGLAVFAVWRFVK